MGKEVRWGPGEAVWSILLALLHILWLGASQGNCSTTTGRVVKAESRGPPHLPTQNFWGSEPRNFYFSQAFLSFHKPAL